MQDSIHINAAPAEIWPHIEDPIAMSFWHPKIAKVEQVIGSGEYTVDFIMHGKPRTFTTRIETSEQPKRLVLVHADSDGRRVRETFDLTPKEAGTDVRHTLDLSAARIPWPWRLVIGFITRFGEPQGAGPLDNLKKHIEHQTNPPEPQTTIVPTPRP